MDSLKIELVCKASAELFLDKRQQLNLEGQWEVATSGISYSSLCKKGYWWKNYVIWHEFFKLIRTLFSGNRSLPFINRDCRSHEQGHLREIQLHRNFYRSQNVSKNAKSWDPPPRTKDRVWRFSVRTWVAFVKTMSAVSFLNCWEEKDCLLTTLPAYNLS